MRYITLALIICFLAIGAVPSQAAKARKKVDPAALFDQAQEAYEVYDFDTAVDKLDQAEKELKRLKKTVLEEYDELRSSILMGRNMLDRVEKIQIIDSLVVDSEDFFKFYELSREAGKLMPGSILSSTTTRSMPAVVYQPQSNREVFWGEEDADGNIELVSAQILDDGTFEKAQPMGAELGEGGDADYLYFMPDGITFYFANNGVNSLGGYDIFLSRRQPDGTVLQPQNVGMPYNSPYDDYMLVIDETAHRGWWATDRNQIPGKVTIYVFIPNEVRQNYSSDDPNLANYARVTSIAETQSGAGILTPVNTQEAEDSEPEFRIAINGKIYTRYSQLRNVNSENAMRQYQDRLKDLQMMEAQLKILRQRYRQGDKSVSNDIKNMEKRILAAQPMLVKLRNQAIIAETK